MKAIALAAKELPAMNGHFGADGFAPSHAVHLGLAVALRGGGLVAPAILDADRLRLVITSYSIHYTKLYNLLVSFLLVLNRFLSLCLPVLLVCRRNSSPKAERPNYYFRQKSSS